MTVSKICSIIKRYCDKNNIHEFNKRLIVNIVGRKTNIDYAIVIEITNVGNYFEYLVKVNSDGTFKYSGGYNFGTRKYKYIKLSSLIRAETLKEILIKLK
jgi:hypothetical protein